MFCSFVCQGLAFFWAHSVLHPVGVSLGWLGASLHVYLCVLVGAFQASGLLLIHDHADSGTGIAPPKKRLRSIFVFSCSAFVKPVAAKSVEVTMNTEMEFK
jgi:hypothetical protein